MDLALYGCEVDPTVLVKASQSGLSEADLRHVEIRDFVLDPPPQTFPAMVANPPYIRHHRLSLSYTAPYVISHTP